MFKNWKTSLSGLGAIITGISLFFKGDAVSGISAVVTGIGLIAAKDSTTTIHP